MRTAAQADRDGDTSNADFYFDADAAADFDFDADADFDFDADAAADLECDAAADVCFASRCAGSLRRPLSHSQGAGSVVLRDRWSAHRGFWGDARAVRNAFPYHCTFDGPFAGGDAGVDPYSKTIACAGDDGWAGATVTSTPGNLHVDPHPYGRRPSPSVTPYDIAIRPCDHARIVVPSKLPSAH